MAWRARHKVETKQKSTIKTAKAKKTKPYSGTTPKCHHVGLLWLLFWSMCHSLCTLLCVRLLKAVLSSEQNKNVSQAKNKES